MRNAHKAAEWQIRTEPTGGLYWKFSAYISGYNLTGRRVVSSHKLGKTRENAIERAENHICKMVKDSRAYEATVQTKKISASELCAKCSEFK